MIITFTCFSQPVFANEIFSIPVSNSNGVNFSIEIENVTTDSAQIIISNDEDIVKSYTLYQYDNLLNSWQPYAQSVFNIISLTDLTDGMRYEFRIEESSYDVLNNSVIYQDITFTTKAEVTEESDESLNEDASSVEQESEEELETVSLKLPKVSGETKTYAYYTAVTDKSSAAWAVLNSGTYKGKTYETYTDEQTGIRMVDDCYCAALGTYYGTEKGTKYLVTLDSGKTFKIILCDSKSNRHTDKKNQYGTKNGDIIEFYVEKSCMPSCMKRSGSYNVMEQFNGAIVSIEKIIE